MARNFVIQATLKGQLEQDFRTFKKREGLTDADATRQLLTLALRIALNDSDDERPSNRDLLEEIYRNIQHQVGVGNLTHSQTFDVIALSNNKSESMEMRRMLKADVDNKVAAYLSGENKES